MSLMTDQTPEKSTPALILVECQHTAPETNWHNWLAMMFTFLKLSGDINWAWVWVLAPVWIWFVLVLIVGTLSQTWHMLREFAENKEKL